MTRELGGLNWAFITLEHCPRDEVVQWTKDIVALPTTDKCVLGTHAWQVPGGELDNGNQFEEQISGGGRCGVYYGGLSSFCNAPTDIFNEIHALYPEKMVLTFGQHHTKGQSDNSFAEKRTDIINGHNVNQASCNFQNLSCPNEAYVRFFTFNTGAGTIDVSTYNATTNTWKTDGQNQFQFQF
jgi:hypothetical protein